MGSMTRVDGVILAWLDSNDIVFTPSTLHANLERDLPDEDVPSYSQVSRRVRSLQDTGLLDQYGSSRGKYNLSDLGTRLLEDDLTEDEVIRLSDYLRELRR